MTKAMIHAFDAARRSKAVSPSHDVGAARRNVGRPPVLARREMSVLQALQWAFGTECAQLEFDEVNPDARVVGCDPIWRMMQQSILGCRVDGGGRSDAADDAEVIASIVARLPVALGGKAMADQVARLARAAAAPDWMPDATPRCVPRDGFRLTKHGEFARTETVGQVETLYRGRKVVHDLLACPVSYRPSAAQISSARRAYLDWWGALLHLQAELRACGLTTITITRDMPPMTPWRNGC